MLLLALQTTPAVSSDRRLDAITLILVVIFIASMAALSVLIRRRPSEESDGSLPAPPLDPTIPRSPAPDTPAVRTGARSKSADDSPPAWLQGVTLPTADAHLSDATRLIEELLDARRNRDLPQGLSLYSPRMRRELQEQLGVDEDELADALRNATIDGDPPLLRSVELISAGAVRMTVRVAYSSGSPETYELARIDGRWLIDAITPSR